MSNIAIFGATSAIAGEVARLYAARGDRLFLAGRRGDGLARLAADLTVRGAAAAIPFEVDFADVTRFSPMLDACEAAIGRPDVVLLAYGSLPDQRENERDPERAARELHINFVSPAVLLDAAALRLAPGGRIAAITSVAGDRGRQSNYLYGAAKGGLSRYLQGLRHRLASDGIKVVDVRPGFVDTPMTAHIDKGGPLWAAPEKVAADIVRALERGRSTVYTPWFWGPIMRIVRTVPERLFHRTKL
jgi:NAD(P)-dependent dehydrogenase (short-subunit alcohol dehydrogenase family)